MIVISTYNPERDRTTEDEEILTAMLAAFIAYRNIVSDNLKFDCAENVQAYFLSQKEAIDKVIPQVSSLLGLSQTEVFDLIKKEKK